MARLRWRPDSQPASGIDCRAKRAHGRSCLSNCSSTGQAREAVPEPADGLAVDPERRVRGPPRALAEHPDGAQREVRLAGGDHDIEDPADHGLVLDREDDRVVGLGDPECGEQLAEVPATLAERRGELGERAAGQRRWRRVQLVVVAEADPAGVARRERAPRAAPPRPRTPSAAGRGGRRRGRTCHRAAASIAPASASRSTQRGVDAQPEREVGRRQPVGSCRARVAGHQRIVLRRCRTLRLVSGPSRGERDDQRAGDEAAGGADRARAQRAPDVHGHLALLRAPEPQGLGEAVPRAGRRGGRARRQDHGVPDRQRGGLRAARRSAARRRPTPSARAAVETALASEQKVTGLFETLVNTCRDAQDNRSLQFLWWFVEEQVEEERTARALLDLIDSGINLFQAESMLGDVAAERGPGRHAPWSVGALEAHVVRVDDREDAVAVRVGRAHEDAA